MLSGLNYKHSEFWSLLVVFCGGGALALTLVLEHVFNLEPCSLCLTQRYLMFVGVLVAVASLALEPRLGILPFISIVFFLGGIGFAFWHLYLIFGPELGNDCGTAAAHLIAERYPIASILEALFAGTPDCSDSHPAIPILAILAFVVLVGLSVQQFRLGPRSSN